MLGFTDSLLRTVWAAADRVPFEKRGVFIERVVARLHATRLHRCRSRRRRARSIDRTSPIGGLMAHRHFPPPWSVEDIGAAFVVRDDSGQSLAYVYFEDEPGQRSAAKLVSNDEARRIGANIAMLPKLLRK
jgi:hypothetical protein